MICIYHHNIQSDDTFAGGLVNSFMMTPLEKIPLSLKK